MKKRCKNINATVAETSNVKTTFIKMCSIKLNEIVKKFLLAGDQFRPEMHLKQPGFTYSPCGPFTKKKKELKNLKKQKIQNIFDELELDKACVQHDMAYGDFKNLGRRTASDKCLRDKAFIKILL